MGEGLTKKRPTDMNALAKSIVDDDMSDRTDQDCKGERDGVSRSDERT